MKVSEQSWHLRYVRWWDELGEPKKKQYMPRDLCSYFWRVVGVVVAMPLAIAVILAWAGYIVFLIVSAFIDNWLLALLWTAGIVGGGALLFGIAIGIVVISDRDPKPKKPKKIKREKEPGLLRSYLSARKRKVCPLIEVVED